MTTPVQTLLLLRVARRLMEKIVLNIPSERGPQDDIDLSIMLDEEIERLTPQASDALTQRARTLVAAGRAAYEAGRLEDAREYFDLAARRTFR